MDRFYERNSLYMINEQLVITQIFGLSLVLSTLPYEGIHPSYDLIGSSSKNTEYRGKDIKFLDTQRVRHPWQNSLLNLFYDEDSDLFLDNDRYVHWIIDPRGVAGKSKFIKWFCTRHPDETMKISFGTTNQLRTGVIGAGSRRVYFLDIPKSKNKDDSIESVINVVEDIVNGFISSFMYGRYRTLLMDPPHVFVFSNGMCDKHLLSEDRWQVYKITKDLKLKKKRI